MASQEQIKELILRKDELYKFIDIKGKQLEVNEFETKSQQDSFWDNPKEAQILLKKLSTLKSWLTSYSSVTNNIDELSVLLELEAKEDELDVQLKKTKQVRPGPTTPTLLPHHRIQDPRHYVPR